MRDIERHFHRGDNAKGSVSTSLVALAFINTEIVGAFAGLLRTALPLGISIGTGVAVFLVSVFVLQRYQWLQGQRNLGTLSVRFPSGAAE